MTIVGEELQRLAAVGRDGGQIPRLMALAAVADGKNRTEAVAIGLMDRQTLRDWVIRFNEQGLEGLINKKPPGHPSKLIAEHRSELAQIIENGPADYVPGLIRWRCIDLVPVVKERFGVECHLATISRILHELGFSHIRPYSSYLGPQHPKQNEQTIEEYEKLR